MSKPVTNAALQKMLSKTGTEPFVILGVSWGQAEVVTTGTPFDGQFSLPALTPTNITLPGSPVVGIDWYSSKAIHGYRNNIIKISPCRHQKKADSVGTIASMSFTLSDTDGYMKWIIDNSDTERKPARVVLGYLDLDFADYTELLAGHITGPVTWDEDNRSVSFTVESITDIVEDELGYSASDSDFNDLAASASGVPWPMMFGECTHVPALKVREHTIGHLIGQIQLFKSPSYTIALNDHNSGITLAPYPDVYSYISTEKEKNVIYVEGGSEFPFKTDMYVSIDGVIFYGQFVDSTKFKVKYANCPKYINTFFSARDTADTVDIDNYSVAWISIASGESDYRPLAGMYCYLHTDPTYQWFNYCVRQEGAKCWFRYPFYSPITGEKIKIAANYYIEAAYGINKNGMQIDVMGTIHRLANRNTNIGNITGTIASTMYKLESTSSSWYTAESDTEVHFWGSGDPDIYVASLIELSNIKAVYGKRRVQMPNGKSKTILDQIPSTYYTIQYESNYKVNHNFATGIIFDTPLSDYNQDWEDEIYVSGTSTIGPNIASIIRWIFTTYTLYTPDGTFGVDTSNNFPGWNIPALNTSSILGSVKDLLDVTPANFAMLDKRNPIQVACEIAFQARCALILDSVFVSIRFLPLEPPFAFTFDLSNIEQKTIELGFTNLSDLRTKVVGTWHKSYRDRERLSKAHESRVTEIERIVKSLVPTTNRRSSESEFEIFTNNVARYGLRVREETFYIFNQQSNVLKSLRFWGWRWSNSWKKIKFRTFLFGCVLQPFDGIILDIPDILDASMPAVVEAVEFNPETCICSIEAWIPVLTGTYGVDPKAWPGV